MANLGSIGSTPVLMNVADPCYYPFTTTGQGKITGTVQENGSGLVGKTYLIDEVLTKVIDVQCGSTFAFKGVNLNRKYTIVCQDPTNTNFNSLIYDRITPAALP